MMISKQVVTEAFRGLVSQGVLDGKSVEAARSEAAEKLSNSAGRTVAELLADQELRSVSLTFSNGPSGTANAQEDLKRAALFFGVSPDELRKDLSGAIASASALPESVLCMRQAVYEPGLSPVKRLALFMEALGKHLDDEIRAAGGDPSSRPKGSALPAVARPEGEALIQQTQAYANSIGAATNLLLKHERLEDFRDGVARGVEKDALGR